MSFDSEPEAVKAAWNNYFPWKDLREETRVVGGGALIAAIEQPAPQPQLPEQDPFDEPS